MMTRLGIITWLLFIQTLVSGQMLSDALGVPFPRTKRPAIKPSLLHTHLLAMPRDEKTIAVFRDGRDVMVSLYFHMLFENDTSSPFVVHETRRALRFSDYNDVKNNLPRFIEYVFDKDKRSLSPYHFTWAEFVDSWYSSEATKVRYEDFVYEPAAELIETLRKLGGKQPATKTIDSIVNKYSFENQTKRKAGQEDRQSFLRKGQPGDWREKFNSDACKVFSELAGEQLITLGYEISDKWVNEL